MQPPTSISIAELQAKLDDSVSRAIRQLPELARAEPNPAFFPDIGTIGFILRDLENRELRLAEVHEVSRGIADRIDQGSAITVLRDKDIIFGYYPRANRL